MVGGAENVRQEKEQSLYDDEGGKKKQAKSLLSSPYKKVESAASRPGKSEACIGGRRGPPPSHLQDYQATALTCTVFGWKNHDLLLLFLSFLLQGEVRGDRPVFVPLSRSFGAEGGGGRTRLKEEERSREKQKQK